MNSFFTLHSFSEVGKTQDLPSKFWQNLGDALRQHSVWSVENNDELSQEDKVASNLGPEYS
jgi:hypothetical protein